MTNTKLLLSVVLITSAGCDEDAVDTLHDRDGVSTVDTSVDPDAAARTLVIAPQRLSVLIENGQPVLQAYTATLIGRDGSERDVTKEVRFDLANPKFGSFDGRTLHVTGAGAGLTEVVASIQGVSTRAELTVYVRGTRVEGSAPANSLYLFAGAATALTCSSTIAYPTANLIAPANLGELDVHWTDANNDLFAVNLKNTYVDLTIYTRGRDVTSTYFTTFEPTEWSPISTSKVKTRLSVTALDTAAGVKCATPTRTIDVTNQDALGGVYYWSTDWAARNLGEPGQNILRYDLSTPELAPSKFLGDATQGTCVGCHAISRDGSKIAYTLDGADGRGAVLDLASGRTMMPTGELAPRWSSAVFNHDASKLLAVSAGQMKLLEADGGAQLAELPNTHNTIASNPEFSPDGTMLASVETTIGEDWAFGNASVVVRSFDNATNTFGAVRMLLPYNPMKDIQSYYPSWSPDGKWLAVTRSSGENSYNNPDATIWVIKADGTMPAIEITNMSGLTDSWARWLPFETTAGGDNEQIFYLSFSSTREFGTRIPQGGRPQIWLTPFFPQRALNGQDPTGTAIRAPFQDVNSSNHSAQWTTGVVSAD